MLPILQRISMKAFIRRLVIAGTTGTVALLLAAVLLHPIRPALAQQSPMMDHAMHDQMPGMIQQHDQKTEQINTSTPTMPGQDAFGAIQEIVRILEADPKTDWSKVNLEALRQHLIDMNEVTLKAAAVGDAD